VRFAHSNTGMRKSKPHGSIDAPLNQERPVRFAHSNTDMRKSKPHGSIDALAGLALGNAGQQLDPLSLKSLWLFSRL
jgi:hypothetical protein